MCAIAVIVRAIFKIALQTQQMHDGTFLIQAMLVKHNVYFLIRLHRNCKKGLRMQDCTW